MKQARICNFSNELLKLMALRGISTYTELERKAHLETKISGFINSGRALPVSDLNKLCDTLGVGHDYFKPFLESVLVFKLNEVGKTVGHVNDNTVMRPISPSEAKKPVQVTYNKYKTGFYTNNNIKTYSNNRIQKKDLEDLKTEFKSELNETDKVLEEIKKKRDKDLTPEERRIKARDYYAKNREKILAQKKAKRDGKKLTEAEKKKEYNATYYAKNREKIRKQQNEANRKKALEKRLAKAQELQEKAKEPVNINVANEEINEAPKKKGGFFSWLRKK